MLSAALNVALGMLCLAMLANLWRLAIGPDLTDRLVALDTLYINGAGLLIVYGMTLASARLFEAALLIAMLGFTGTVAFSKYLLRGDIIE